MTSYLLIYVVYSKWEEVCLSVEGLKNTLGVSMRVLLSMS